MPGLISTATALMLIAVPLSSVLIPNAMTWAKDLNSLARRVRKLEEQNRIVAFWENWIRTVSSTKVMDRWFESRTEEQIGIVMHEARLELMEAGRTVLLIYRDELYRELNEFKLTYKEFQSYRLGLPWFRRVFLLYKAPNRLAKSFKIIFHLNLLAPIVISAVEIPVLSHLERIGFLPRPDAWSSTTSQFAKLHPALHLTFIAFLFIMMVFLWLGTSARQRWISRKHEDDKQSYVRDREEDRIRGIKAVEA